jgi:hypothetical protein
MRLIPLQGLAVAARPRQASRLSYGTRDGLGNPSHGTASLPWHFAHDGSLAPHSQYGTVPLGSASQEIKARLAVIPLRRLVTIFLPRVAARDGCLSERGPDGAPRTLRVRFPHSAPPHGLRGPPSSAVLVLQSLSPAVLRSSSPAVLSPPLPPQPPSGTSHTARSRRRRPGAGRSRRRTSCARPPALPRGTRRAPARSPA